MKQQHKHRLSRNKSNINKINNNNTTTNPSSSLTSNKTDLLRFFITTTNTGELRSSLSNPIKLPHPFSSKKKLHFKRQINPITHNNNNTNALSPSSFNNDLLFLEQAVKDPTKVSTLNHLMRKSCIDQIKCLVLPKIKSDLSSLTSDASAGYIKMTFSAPVIKKQISFIANEVSRNEYSAPKYHELKSNYLIHRMINENKKLKKKIHLSIMDTRTYEEKEESYDKFTSDDLQIIKIKKAVSSFLGAKDNKLNQQEFQHYPFFESLENKINFIYDSYQLPTFKNKFINYNGIMDNLNEYKNIIDSGINRYLNILKYHIQYKKDNKRSGVFDEQEIEINNNTHHNVNENIKDETLERNLFDVQEINSLKPKDKDSNNQMYGIENFFLHKYSKYDAIAICKDKKIYNVIFNIIK